MTKKQYASTFGDFSIDWTAKKPPSKELEGRMVGLVGALLPTLLRYRRFMLDEFQNGIWTQSIVISYPIASSPELDFDLWYDPVANDFGLQIKEGSDGDVIASVVIPGKIEL
jgi:hypothetical protein